MRFTVEFESVWVTEVWQAGIAPVPTPAATIKVSACAIRSAAFSNWSGLSGSAIPKTVAEYESWWRRSSPYLASILCQFDGAMSVNDDVCGEEF